MQKTRGAAELAIILAAASGIAVAAVTQTQPIVVADPVGLLIAALLGMALRASVLINQRRLKNRDVAVGDLILTAFASAFAVIVYREISRSDPFGWHIPRTDEITWAVAMLVGFVGGSVIFRSSWRRWESATNEPIEPVAPAMPGARGGDHDAT
jgi:hypothetical protein